MEENLHKYRKSYEKDSLNKTDVNENPVQQFTKWFREAEESGTVEEINAMTLSTIGIDGFPRGRVVLLKEFGEAGFIFYTNYESEKGKAIAQNPNVSIAFFWPVLQRQVLIKGTVNKISEAESVAYFKVRPRGSQLGALVSDQSSKIENRNALELRLQNLENKYEGMEIPKPINWGGYCIAPTEFEFWQGRRNRLHDRIQYSRENNEWVIIRLQP